MILDTPTEQTHWLTTSDLLSFQIVASIRRHVQNNDITYAVYLSKNISKNCALIFILLFLFFFLSIRNCLSPLSIPFLLTRILFLNFSKNIWILHNNCSLFLRKWGRALSWSITSLAFQYFLRHCTHVKTWLAVLIEWRRKMTHLIIILK